MSVEISSRRAKKLLDQVAPENKPIALKAWAQTTGVKVVRTTTRADFVGLKLPDGHTPHRRPEGNRGKKLAAKIRNKKKTHGEIWGGHAPNAEWK